MYSSRMSTLSQQFRAFGVGLILAFGAYAVGQIVVTATALGFIGIGFNIQNRPAVLLGISVVMLQGVTFGGIALLYMRYQDLGIEFIQVRMPSLRDLAMALAGFGALFGLLRVISLVLSKFGLQSA